MSIFCSLLMGTKVLLAGILISIVYLLYLERKLLYLDRSKKEKIILIVSTIIFMGIAIFLFTKTRTYKNMMVQQSFFKASNLKDFINHIIFNDRLSFLKENFDYMRNVNIFKWLLGIGFNDGLKLVEIDVFDILFRYGIIGVSLFIYMFSKIKFKELADYEKLSLILLIVISLTSGHVLIYPNVCIYIALITSKNIK